MYKPLLDSKQLCLVLVLLSLLAVVSPIKAWFMIPHHEVTVTQSLQIHRNVVHVLPVMRNVDVPVGYQVLKVQSTHSAYIGTADNPTIDGGLLNTTDGIPIAQEPLPAVKATVVQNGSATVPPDKANKDDWATSERVKRLLVSAAKTGKLAYVLKKSDAMGLPASVAVVPMVESNYQSTAVSTKGAAGAWQLMPSVAKDYGLSNQDRQIFTRSTDAALQLLNTLHQQFGNWEYAFAAYNAGATRVKNAINKNPQATSVDALDLPTETKQYVKRIISLNKTMMTLPEHT